VQLAEDDVGRVQRQVDDDVVGPRRRRDGVQPLVELGEHLAAGRQGDLTGRERLEEGRPVQPLHEEVQTVRGVHLGHREPVPAEVSHELDLARQVVLLAVAPQDAVLVDEEDVRGRPHGQQRSGGLGRLGDTG
jgi:hypothetical protein